MNNLNREKNRIQINKFKFKSSIQTAICNRRSNNNINKGVEY